VCYTDQFMAEIRIKGARVHNLKNVDVTIPKNKLVVLTGVSGSGKSSLAFDTLYAEGQRRYVESLSAYARQFLGIMEKPDVDMIEGLSPAISIDQKTASHNPRSTVGTVTEIYDYLRLLYARIGTPYCPNCEIPVKRMSADEIVETMIADATARVSEDKLRTHGFLVFAPVVKNKRGEFKELFDNVRYKGFSYTRIDGYYYDLDNEDLFIFKNNKHTIDIIIDRFSLDKTIIKDEARMAELRSRLFRAIENALALTDGLVSLGYIKDKGFDIPVKPKEVEERIYSERFACPQCGTSFTEIEPRLFSFNSPIGACTECRGLGVVLRVDENRLYNTSLTLAEGGFFPFSRILNHDTWFGRLVREVIEKHHINIATPIGNLSEEDRDILLHGSDTVFHVRGRNREGAMTSIHEKFRGFAGEVQHRYYDTSENQPDYERYMIEEICPVCNGKRLNELALHIKLQDKTISDLCNLSIHDEVSFLQEHEKGLSGQDKTIATPILKEIYARLHFLDEVGLSYLTLARRASTLSGGEAQRIRLASQIGTGLTGITYVLDEPSIGLHSRDVSRLLGALMRLRDLGNTVVVVEHDWETIEHADHIIDFGPKAGKHGGQVIATGTVDDIKKSSESITGAYLSGKRRIQSVRMTGGTPEEIMTIKGCSEHNLKNISVTMPLKRMVGITGVSGSGKSTFLLDTVYPAIRHETNEESREHLGAFKSVEGISTIERVVLIDQSPIGRTPRSNPATYTGVFTDIREVFAATLDAKAQGYKPGRFSFNVRGGRCENCQGAGSIKVEMQFLADLYVTCDVCKGARYNRETLDVRFKGKNIAEVLKMTVDEALFFFEHNSSIVKILMVLQHVGLGYMELGQSAPTLSGGEAQRVKLAKELYTNIYVHTAYILDEPTTGLHFYDVDKLIKVLRHLVSQGNSVFVIEHNLDVIKNCDYVVDLGPEGGDGGGKVLFQGTVDELLTSKKADTSYTAQYVREYVGHAK